VIRVDLPIINDDDNDSNDDDEEDVDGTANAESSRQNTGGRSNASQRILWQLYGFLSVNVRRSKNKGAKRPQICALGTKRKATPVHCAVAVRRPRARGVYICESRETWTREIEISIGELSRRVRFNVKIARFFYFSYFGSRRPERALAERVKLRACRRCLHLARMRICESASHHR